MRAKLKVDSVSVLETCDVLNLSAVAKSSDYPEDGSDENNTFAKFTPSASLQITITNPALFGQFRPGQTFYVDFTRADVSAAS